MLLAFYKSSVFDNIAVSYIFSSVFTGNTKGESNTVPLTSCFGLVSFANKNKNCLLSYSWFQTSQTGGQLYSDTSPFNIPWYLFCLSILCCPLYWSKSAVFFVCKFLSPGVSGGCRIRTRYLGMVMQVPPSLTIWQNSFKFFSPPFFLTVKWELGFVL
jgi:hypothetical protein